MKMFVASGIILLLVGCALFYQPILAHVGVARFQLGMASKYSSSQETCNPERTLFWLNRAAENDRLEAFQWLGDIHSAPDINPLKRFPVEKNLKRAGEWYEKAARRGSQNAMGKLGILYSYGCSPLKGKPETEISENDIDFQRGYLWLLVEEKRAAKTGERLFRGAASAKERCEKNLPPEKRKLVAKEAVETEKQIPVWHGSSWGK